MTWVRIDDKVSSHPKVTSAKRLYLEALGLWVAGIAHCNSHHTDGVIMKHELRALAPVDAVPMSKLRLVVDTLVATKRWHDEGDRWRVHGYEDEQEDALKTNVAQRREYERTRKRVQRETARLKKQAELDAMSQRDRPRDRPGTTSGTTTGQHRGQPPGRPLPPPPPTDNIAPPGDPITPIPIIRELSQPPGPARPGPARSSDAVAAAPVVDPRIAAMTAELRRHRHITSIISDLDHLAEQCLGQNLGAEETALVAAMRDGAAELPELATDALIRRTLRKFAKYARTDARVEASREDPASDWVEFPPDRSETAATPEDRAAAIRRGLAEGGA